MHPAIFSAFEEICQAQLVGGDILEIGAMPTGDTLLRLPALRNARRRVGINLQPAFKDEAIEIVSGNANAMTDFADGSFDAVVSNSVLEHDPSFWLTLAETRRVTRPGGLIAIGVPGFGAMKTIPFWRLMRATGFLQLPQSGHSRPASWIAAATPTLGLHSFPGDYYRFSEAAVREVFLGGLSDIGVATLLKPPRFIGWGRAPVR